MSKEKSHQNTPTLMDHHELNFWLWAFLRNGEAYLKQSKITDAAFESPLEQYEDCRRELKLAEYHFVATMGTLTRVLKRAQHLFPTIQPAYSMAKHLISEGPSLRGLIEHADEYFAGEGNHPDQWERRNSPTPGIVVDASSTIINQDGHWLGGRFNVERAIAEVKAIAVEAFKIPPSSAHTIRR
jgi:hypothetical protein